MDKFWKSKNHLRNQTEKFWKSKNHLRNQTEKCGNQKIVSEIKRTNLGNQNIILEIKRTNFGNQKITLEIKRTNFGNQKVISEIKWTNLENQKITLEIKRTNIGNQKIVSEIKRTIEKSKQIIILVILLEHRTEQFHKCNSFANVTRKKFRNLWAWNETREGHAYFTPMKYLLHNRLLVSLVLWQQRNNYWRQHQQKAIMTVMTQQPKQKLITPLCAQMSCKVSLSSIRLCHPLSMYGRELVQRDKLKSLSMDELKDICISLEIEISDVSSKKRKSHSFNSSLI